MTLLDVYLRAVPSDTNINDVRLYDPTTFTPPVGGADFRMIRVWWIGL